MDWFIIVFSAAIPAMVPLLLAGMGELVVEKSGTLNLGIEGMMLMGCVSGFITAIASGSLLLGFIVATFAGMAMSLLFALFTVYLRTNQVATGLALTIFGIGLSSFIGLPYVGEPLSGLAPLPIPLLADLPILGRLIFTHDMITYLAFALLALLSWFLYHSHYGLILRAVGDNHYAAYAMGYSVTNVRLLAILFGGCMSGLAGAYLSLVYTPLWTEQMTAGKGWIVLALVVFATWQPWRLLLGAFLFGLVSIAQLFLQGSESWLHAIPAQFFSMLPYIVTIIVLVLVNYLQRQRNRLPATPACLGVAFEPK